MDASALLHFPRTDTDRLRLALRHLNEALANQKAAVEAFRSELAALRQATASLSGQVNNYQDRLAETAHSIGAAHDAALVLDRSADRMLAQAR